MARTITSKEDNLSPLDKSRDGDKYKIDNLMYPMELGTPEYEHHVVFYINVDSTSKFLGDEEQMGERSYVGQNRSAAHSGQIGKVADGLSESFGNKEKASGDVATKKKDDGSLIEVGKAAGDSLKTSFGVGKSMRRLKAAVALTMPQSFIANYGVQYKTGELGSVLGAAMNGGISNLVNVIKGEGLKGVAGTYAGDTARIIADQLANKIPVPKNLANVENALQAASRRVQNPYMEQLFESVNFRTFLFNYEFTPKSEQEARNVAEIIKSFKFHMHPEIVQTGLFYLYPSEFDIVIYFKDKQNEFVNKISTCVLTECSVNYASSGSWSTLRNGMPTEVTMQLSFKEVEPLTKERIKEGY